MTPRQRALVGELRRAQTPSDRVPTSVSRPLAEGGDGGVNVEFARHVDVAGRGDAWIAPGDGRICLVTTDPQLGADGGSTNKCRRLAEVERGMLYTTWISGENPETGATTVVGVVPNGVRSVVVTDDDGSRRVAGVRHNLYVVRGGRARWVDFDSPRGHRRVKV